MSIAFFLPSDPAENRRRSTFLKEEGKKIKTGSALGLYSLAAGLVFSSPARGRRPQAGGGVATSINSTGTLVFSDMRSKNQKQGKFNIKDQPYTGVT